MVNFLIVMCILIALSAAGIVVKKIIKTEKYRQKYTRYQAPKKSKSISLASNDDAIS